MLRCHRLTEHSRLEVIPRAELTGQPPPTCRAGASMLSQALRTTSIM